MTNQIELAQAELTAAYKSVRVVEREQDKAESDARTAVYREFADRLSAARIARVEAQKRLDEAKLAAPRHLWEGLRAFCFDACGGVSCRFWEGI